MIIKKGRIITPTQILEGYDILVENGIIKDIGLNLKGEDLFDANGGYVAPGFVDIHTHGGYEADFMDGNEKAFSTAVKFHLDNGTTTIVPTSCTAPKESIINFINFTKNYLATNPKIKRIVVGVHLEGPYLSVRNKGAQKEDDLAIPEKDDYSYIIENKDIIKSVTISPELNGADFMSKRLSSVGITVCGGHDDGIYPEFMPAIDNGLSHLTHLYCAMSELRFKDGNRNVGLREYALIDDRLTVELIADNRHVPPQLAKLVVKCKGADKVAVVSDSLRCAGCPSEGKLYKLGSDENAQLVKIGDGVAITEDGTRYAGSITPVRLMVKNLIDCGINLVDAVKMGSLTPARIIKEDKFVGSLEVGKRANILILDSGWNIKKTFIDGEPING